MCVNFHVSANFPRSVRRGNQRFLRYRGDYVPAVGFEQTLRGSSCAVRGATSQSHMRSASLHPFCGSGRPSASRGGVNAEGGQIERMKICISQHNRSSRLSCSRNLFNSATVTKLRIKSLDGAPPPLKSNQPTLENAETPEFRKWLFSNMSRRLPVLLQLRLQMISNVYSSNELKDMIKQHFYIHVFEQRTRTTPPLTLPLPQSPRSTNPAPSIGWNFSSLGKL